MKKFFALVIDIFISFGIIGYLIGSLTGQTTENGFKLNGLPAVILIVEIILYFVLSKKLFGKTIGQKILGI